jgi:uncharacterized phage protein (TIGR01671 family)
MSREIKFRAWNNDLKLYSKPFTLKSSILNFTDKNGLGVMKSLSDEIIEQFTGLKDINGKEIYEGDICKHNNDIAVIVFWEGAFIFNKYYTHNNSLTNFACIRTFEIIGNIYETPELLQS